MKRVLEQLAEFLIRWRYVALVIAIGGALVCQWPASKLKYNRSIETMFADDDPLLAGYAKLRETFGGNEVVLLVYQDPDLLAADGRGIKRLEQLNDRVKSIDGVSEVLSLAELNRILIDFPESMTASLKDLPLALRLGLQRIVQTRFDSSYPICSNDIVVTQFRSLFESYTHSADRQIAAVVCMLAPGDERNRIVQEIKQAAASLPDDFPTVRIAGEPVMIEDGFNMLEADGRQLTWTATSLMAMVIIASFRSIRWMLIPMAVVQFTLLLTESCLVVSGLELTMVSSMFTAIVTVIGVATVIHIIVRFREARSNGLERREALAWAITLLAAPVFWACATDAAGFGALLFASVGPVQDFGLMMLLGSLLVLVSVALLLTGMALIPLPRMIRFLDLEPQRAVGESILSEQLTWPLRIIRRSPWLVFGVFFVSTLAATYGLRFVEIESDFTKNFRSDSQIVKSYRFVEENLSGAGAWDILVEAPATLDFEYLKRIERLEQRLRSEVVVETGSTTEKGLTNVLSLSDASLKLSPIDLELLPVGRDLLIGQLIAQMKNAMPIFTAALYAPDPETPERYWFRIMLRSRERQTARDKLDIIRQVTLICEEELASPDLTEGLSDDSPSSGAAVPHYEITGYFVLLTQLIASTLRDQWLTFSIAIGLIGAMMVIAFRSFRLALIALVPNILPILFVLGILGWSSIRINMGAAMIAAVSMGLSIDSSVHYIIAFQRELNKGRSTTEAISRVQQQVGRAVVFSTVAMVVGFSSLLLSQFVPTIYFGALVSLSMLGGLLGNLLLLPLLLTIAFPRPAQVDRADIGVT